MRYRHRKQPSQNSDSKTRPSNSTLKHSGQEGSFASCMQIPGSQPIFPKISQINTLISFFGFTDAVLQKGFPSKILYLLFLSSLITCPSNRNSLYSTIRTAISDFRTRISRTRLFLQEKISLLFPLRNSPTRAKAASFLTLLGHTK